MSKKPKNVHYGYVALEEADRYYTDPAIDVLSMPLSYEGGSPVDLEHAHRVTLTIQLYIRTSLREVSRE